MRASPIPLTERQEAIKIALQERDFERAEGLRGDLYVELLEWLIEINADGYDVSNHDIIKFLKTEELFR